MPATKKKRNLHAPKRRESSLKPAVKRATASKLRSVRAEAEILKLVRTGVERFILKNATVEEFLKTIRALTKKEKAYSHQLTRSVFTRIVREAIRKRNISRSN